MSASNISVAAAGRDWVLQRPENLEELWDNITNDEFAEDERLPYWVELWPSSIALADWLYTNKDSLKGSTCLDLGCGLGLTALVASALGAQVVAIDYEFDALRYARRNAVANAVPQPVWAVMDWRSPAIKKQAFDYIWGGDIMYERRFVTPVLDCLLYALKPGGKIWLAEPNRNVYDDFKRALLNNGKRSKKVYSAVVDPLHVQPNKVNVSLWELE